MPDRKILFFDTESTSLNGDFGFMLAFGWQWLGEPKAHVINLSQFSERCGECRSVKDPTNDRALVGAAAKILSQADHLVTWYGQRFDVPLVNTRLVAHGMAPLPPIAHDDGWFIARYKMRLHSNRLASVSAFLGVEEKTQLKPTIWIKAGAGHKPSIDYVTAHCLQDVHVLRQCYEMIRPLSSNSPNLALGAEGPQCPTCGGGRLTLQGFKYTRTGRKQRFQCNRCGAWSLAARREKGFSAAVA